MKKVLVTGGAGYIGSVLVQLLLNEGYEVRVLDSLRYGGESIVDLLNHPRFEFVKGDVRDPDTVKAALEGAGHVVHLAAIVGDPACAKEPEAARAINLEASKQLFREAGASGVDRFVFASTCSNYGKMEDPDAMVDEESALAPVSLYAETKVAVEQYLMEQEGKEGASPTSLRFSTVYGLSRRPRFDLTVNEFTRELAMGRELVVYGEQFWRPYCHVVDLARSVIAVLEAPEEKVAYDVFNVGDTAENYTKQMLVDEICKQIPDARIKYVKKEEDPRDYRVSFEKIRERLGFSITMRVPEGIRQVRRAVSEGFFEDPDHSRYQNV